MTRQDKMRGRDVLQGAVGPTAQCVSIEKFGSMTAAEQAHVAACAHCEAEMHLWQQFDANEPSAEEGAAVQWIAAELGRRRAPQPASPQRAGGFSWFGGRALAGLAAALIVTIGIGYAVIDREPPIGAPLGENAYRGATIRAIRPTGDVATAPTSLQWLPISAAAKYDVAIHEIDGTTTWTGSTTAASVTLPPSVVSQFAPGRSLTWEVTARDSSGAIVATSGVQRFRVELRR